VHGVRSGKEHGVIQKRPIHLTEVPNLQIHYSFDETNPDEFYPKYEKALIIPADALHLKVITYRDGKPIGKQINMPTVELQKRVKANKP
jgi:hexosaminidase